MKGFLLFLGVIVTVILGSIWGGYVLSILWAWFIVPTFHLPQISIALAIGLMLLIRSMTYPSSQQSEDRKRESGSMLAFLSAAGVTFGYPLLILGMGAVVHLFV